jgi:hypothetical protein
MPRPAELERGARATHASPLQSRLMTDRAALEREMEEIRAQLDWVRDYL